jgi:hypothetical protein
MKRLREWYHLQQALQTSPMAKYLTTRLYPCALPACVASARRLAKVLSQASQAHVSAWTVCATGKIPPQDVKRLSKRFCHTWCSATALRCRRQAWAAALRRPFHLVSMAT